MRKFILFRLDGKHLTYENRLILQALWNDRIEHLSASLTISSFAREHGLSPETWRREYLKGAEHPPMWNKIKDRPREADDRSEPGHLEMDTVVSSAHGSGGLLVLIDRWSRMYRAVKIRRISQECVLKALRQLVRDGELGEQVPRPGGRGMHQCHSSGKSRRTFRNPVLNAAYSLRQRHSMKRPCTIPNLPPHFTCKSPAAFQ